MEPTHPGDFIRTVIIDELGLNVTKATQILGVRSTTISDLLNGNASPSPEIVLRIEIHSTLVWTLCCKCRLGTMLRRCVHGQMKFVYSATYPSLFSERQFVKVWSQGNFGQVHFNANCRADFPIK